MFGVRAFTLMIGLLGVGPVAIRAADDPEQPATGAEAAKSFTATAESPSTFPAYPTSSYRGDHHDAWASVEYMFGWIRGASAPPLLSATPVGGGSSSILFPNGGLNDDGRGGFQLRGGFWLDGDRTCGIEASTFLLCRNADRAQAGDTPGAVIGRPFFNAQLGVPDFELVAVPGSLSGHVAIDAETSHFCATDLLFRKAICSDCRGRLDCLIGLRCLSYDDSLHVFENLRPTAPPFPPGSQIGVADDFTASNRFYGLLLGVAGEYRFDPWYVEARANASFGQTYRRATVAGATFFNVPPDPPAVVPGGLLALSSNSGSFSGSDWVCVPEASIRLGYRVADRLRVFVGYSCLYWPKVYRAAEQIDPVVNPDLLAPPIIPPTGPIRPLFPDRQSFLWVQAISIGVELRY